MRVIFIINEFIRVFQIVVEVVRHTNLQIAVALPAWTQCRRDFHTGPQQ